MHPATRRRVSSAVHRLPYCTPDLLPSLSACWLWLFSPGLAPPPLLFFVHWVTGLGLSATSSPHGAGAEPPALRPRRPPREDAALFSQALRLGVHTSPLCRPG